MTFTYCGRDSNSANLDIEDKHMSTAVSRGQALEVSARVATQVDWDKVDGESLQDKVIQLTPEEFGRRFTLFIQNECRLTITAPGTVIIDRSKPFNLTAFTGKDWRIEEEDRRSLALTEFNVAKILLQTGLNEGEAMVTGEEKRRRLMGQAIQLDAKVGQTLFEEKGQVTLRWVHEHLGVTWIEFLGTVLVGPYGIRYALFLYRLDDGSWYWNCVWLDHDRYANYPAVGLAS